MGDDQGSEPGRLGSKPFVIEAMSVGLKGEPGGIAGGPASRPGQLIVVGVLLLVLES